MKIKNVFLRFIIGVALILVPVTPVVFLADSLSIPTWATSIATFCIGFLGMNWWLDWASPERR